MIVFKLALLKYLNVFRSVSSFMEQIQRDCADL